MISVDDLQYNNLVTLRNFILNDILPSKYKKLDMGIYIKSEDDLNSSLDCPTSACLLGYSVLALGTQHEFKPGGILFNDKTEVGWNKYAEKYFHTSNNPFEAHGQLWQFIFYPTWSNCIKEALGRLNFIIKTEQIPDAWDYVKGQSFLPYYLEVN